MKRYELIIERQQPPCGGKQTKLYDFRNVETDDPVSYSGNMNRSCLKIWSWRLNILRMVWFQIRPAAGRIFISVI